MTTDPKSVALKQLANLVIDAYMNRDRQFVPVFQEGTKGIMYLSRPDGDEDHPGLRTNVMYERSDYEDRVIPIEQKATDPSTN
jgi:hypothetical protein